MLFLDKIAQENLYNEEASSVNGCCGWLFIFR